MSKIIIIVDSMSITITITMMPPILPMALMLSSSSKPCSLPVSGADFFLNLKLLNGDLDLVMDFPLFFSDAVLDRLDIMAN